MYVVKTPLNSFVIVKTNLVFNDAGKLEIKSFSRAISVEMDHFDSKAIPYTHLKLRGKK